MPLLCPTKCCWRPATWRTVQYLSQHAHNNSDCVLVILTLIILLPLISTVVKFTTSKFHMTSPASGRSTSAPVLKHTTKTSIYQDYLSRMLCPSSTYLPTAQSVRSNTRSITPPVWDKRMARLSSRSGPTLTLPPCPHERWAQAHGIPH